MESSVGIYSYVIDAYLTDFRGYATLPMIGGFMLQAATRHAEERGFGYTAMTKLNKVWVLTRMSIVMTKYPKNDAIMKMHTWVADVNKLFTERCFSFEDENGVPLGYARSVWASIDLESRRPSNVLELDGLSEHITNRECLISPVSKIPLSKELMMESSFRVKYSDIDINKHLNSIKYIEHFIDTFPLEIHVEKEIEKFEINYISEGKYDTQLDIYKAMDKDYIYTFEMKDGDKTICSSRVSWKDRHKLKN